MSHSSSSSLSSTTQDEQNHQSHSAENNESVVDFKATDFVDVDYYIHRTAAGKLGRFLSLHRPAKKETPTTKLGVFRHELGELLESPPVQYTILALIMVDVLALIGELIIEADFPSEIAAEEALLWVSISVLWIFAWEQALLIFAFGWRYFFNPLLVLDLIVITVSLIVDLVLRQALAGFLTLFRLWRLARVVHGLLVAVEEKHHKKLENIHQNLERISTYLSEGRLDDGHAQLKRLIKKLTPEGHAEEHEHGHGHGHGHHHKVEEAAHHEEL